MPITIKELKKIIFKKDLLALCFSNAYFFDILGNKVYVIGCIICTAIDLIRSAILKIPNSKLPIKFVITIGIIEFVKLPQISDKNSLKLDLIIINPDLKSYLKKAILYLICNIMRKNKPTLIDEIPI
tara:strand:- start:53 stop:433 length:381 start_codon:yes stop_codon:yes gene_type:complete